MDAQMDCTRRPGTARSQDRDQTSIIEDKKMTLVLENN